MLLSILVCAYKMKREIPRTLYTLSSSYQRDVDPSRYEIIVLDNGSPEPIDEAAIQAIVPNARVVRPAVVSRSPARAINEAMRSARGSVVALFIDGARMASPGLIGRALEAYRADPTRVIGTLAFHLGPDVQMRSVAAGYDQAAEDELLSGMPWRENGYSLFDISVLAGSSSQGWFGTLAESNAVFLSRVMWNELGGLDERFASAGGGVVNLDFWRRAVERSDYQPWILLGEGTFHQVHGGAATNGTEADRAVMFKEYEQIHGVPLQTAPCRPRLLGALTPELRDRFSGEMPAPPRHAHSIGSRSFAVGLAPDVLDRVQAATLRTQYKRRRLLKNPFDMALYVRLLQSLQPRTIIEIGGGDGGSSLWFRDQCRAFGLDTRILTIDRSPSDLGMPDMSTYHGDSEHPQETFPHDAISTAHKPWLVIEDSGHTYAGVRAVLDYFNGHLTAGDYIVVEDGVVADLRGPEYRRYDDGPNRAVKAFLSEWSAHYRIDTELCDFYGPNVTYCPNGWLVRL